MNQCPFCAFESKCETELNNHINTHDENLSFLSDLDDNKSCFCDYCKGEQLQFLTEDLTVQLPKDNIRVESKEELFPDEINEHTILVDPVRFEPNFQSKKWFKCDQCRYKSKDSENLKRHYILKHGDGTEIPWYYCDHCPYKSKQKSALNVHMKHKHIPDDEIKWYYCDQCSYKTKTKSCLGYHKFQHAKPENIQWHPCGHCDYKAKTRSRLNKHVSELHSPPGDIKWLKCEYCLMYITRRNSSLKLHIRRKHSEFLK